MDHVTHEPLMLAYMNAESLRMTMELGGSRLLFPQPPGNLAQRGRPAGTCRK